MIQKWKRTLGVLAGLLAILLCVVWLSGGFESKVKLIEQSDVHIEQELAGETVIVTKVSAPSKEWVSGTLVSAKHTTVASRVLARVEEVHVRAGSDVNQGDVLITLDSRDLQARVEQVQQQLQAVITKRNLARTERDRNKRLLRESAVSQERYDQSEATLRVARAEVSRVELTLKEAETALSHAVLKASVSGRIVDRLIEPGDTAVPGAALLRIYDPTVLRVEVPIRESLAIHLKLNDTIQVEIPATNKNVEGIVDEIVPFAESGARTLLVKIRMPQDPQLISGMFAKVAIPAGGQTYLTIPWRAVQKIGQLDFVEVITEQGNVDRRLVTIGKSIDENFVEVLSGLKEGEKVAIEQRQ